MTCKAREDLILRARGHKLQVTRWPSRSIKVVLEHPCAYCFSYRRWLFSHYKGATPRKKELGIVSCVSFQKVYLCLSICHPSSIYLSTHYHTNTCINTHRDENYLCIHLSGTCMYTFLDYLEQLRSTRYFITQFFLYLIELEHFCITVCLSIFSLSLSLVTAEEPVLWTYHKTVLH